MRVELRVHLRPSCLPGTVHSSKAHLTLRWIHRVVAIEHRINVSKEFEERTQCFKLVSREVVRQRR